jgi:hypothetical protein
MSELLLQVIWGFGGIAAGCIVIIIVHKLTDWL